MASATLGSLPQTTMELSSTSVPGLTDAEVSKFRAARHDAQVAIYSIDEEVAKLGIRRRNHEHTLRQCDEALAPVKKIPYDVLSSIFLLSLRRDTYGDDEPHPMASSHPAVVASHVCSDWRKASLSTGQLWSEIPVIHPPHPRMTPTRDRPHLVDDAEVRWEAHTTQLFETTQTWISRSGGYPLSITLDLTTSSWGDDTWGGEEPPRDVISKFKGLVDIVCSVASRWESVDISIFANSTTEVEGLLSLKGEDVPLLRTVKLLTHVNESPSYPPINPPPGGFLTGDTLRNLTVLRLPNGSWQSLSVNWAGLQTLRLGVKGGGGDAGKPRPISVYEMLGPLEALNLLSNCPNLTRCDFAVREFDDDRDVVQDWNSTTDPQNDLGKSVTLPHLQTLKFSRTEPLKEFFESIDAPALRNLGFQSSFISNMHPPLRSRLPQRFMTSVERFGAQLTDLRFTLLYLVHDTSAIIRCFDNLPNLVNLHLENAVQRPATAESLGQVEHAAKFLLRYLTPTVNEEGDLNLTDTAVCPNLKHFACTLVTKGFTEAQLVDFIASRRRDQREECRISRIDEVRVAFGVLSQMGVWGRLEEAGVGLGDLTLRVTYPAPLSLKVMREDPSY
ncbi:hypothetical protein FA13DRAFT_817958 [Coprinellus micaceus]|uniref:F-box domain-containing protein n=1 Tax=Coprinellus micaceus TaxID=71717 RepID=A0A4Y7T267_COPMI|nr:hypothetical protein FA13DRAFT_817958 [Coprinellus micaceus]